eukprot:TRINITY_DN26003_c0_g1_i1.p1 TRINITY_DN26003_c0_g1~~TRINITY_DN26003_c0_g1_i1.p1  ORF type:complete len:409 (+),score=91.34 TRINITY_DN26003_c0_g1_i1:77-1303(+)
MTAAAAVDSAEPLNGSNGCSDRRRAASNGAAANALSSASSEDRLGKLAASFDFVSSTYGELLMLALAPAAVFAVALALGLLPERRIDVLTFRFGGETLNGAGYKAKADYGSAGCHPVHLHVHVDLRATALVCAVLSAALMHWAVGRHRSASSQAPMSSPDVGTDDKEPEEVPSPEEKTVDPEVRRLPEELLLRLAEWQFHGKELEERRQREDEEEALKHKRQEEETVIAKTWAAMAVASPALVYRVPAHQLAGDACHSSPVFNACGRLWSLRTGPVLPGQSSSGEGGGGGGGNGGGNGGGGGGGGASASKPHNRTVGARYFCLLPHGHGDRLRFSVLFAKADDGYSERRVHDWPEQLSGHPWGPTVLADDLTRWKQADGSILLMVHAVGLSPEVDPGSGRPRLGTVGG